MDEDKITLETMLCDSCSTYKSKEDFKVGDKMSNICSYCLKKKSDKNNNLGVDAEIDEYY